MAKTSVQALIMTIMLSFAAQSAGAQGKGASPEQTLLQLANRERTAQSLAPLKWSATLAQAAHEHVIRMAQQNTVSHQLRGEPGLADRATGAGARFTSLAENVAEGSAVEGIHHQWMSSAPHRANLLDPELDSVGIAVADRNGTLFAVEDFSREVDNLTIGEQEDRVGAQLQKRGLRLLNYTDDARRSCTLDNGYAGSHVPSFVLHYATPDLATLPAMLDNRIRSGKYHSAAVGACPSYGKYGASSYRIAVLLFD